MKIAITGATGRVGANLAMAAARQGHEVTGIVNPDSPRAGKLDPLDVRAAVADLRDTEAVARAVAGAEAIFHLGASVAAGIPGPDGLLAFSPTRWTQTTASELLKLIQLCQSKGSGDFRRHEIVAH